MYRKAVVHKNIGIASIVVYCGLCVQAHVDWHLQVVKGKTIKVAKLRRL